MDQAALQFQEQLHKQNQERFQRMEDLQIEQVATLARIEENTKQIPQLTQRVSDLERVRDRMTGALAAVGTLAALLGAVLGAALTELVHWIGQKLIR
jgi:hypothetical protein